MIEETSNNEAKITNKEAEEDKETEGEMIEIPKRYIVNRRQSSKMDTIGHTDGKQTTKPPNVSDFSKAMSQARIVTI